MNVITPAVQESVEESLVGANLISEEQLKLIKDEAASKHEPILSLLVNRGHITDEQLTKALANVNKIPYVNLTTAHINSAMLKLLPRETAEQYMAVPLGEMKRQLVVAMLDAENVQAVDFLSNKIGRPLIVYAASESGIRHVLKQYDQSIDVTAGLVFYNPVSALDSDEAAKPQAFEVMGSTSRNIQTIVEDSPVSKVLNSILQYAVKNRASDIHIESLQNELKVRCRIDGVLAEVMTLPKNVESALISRVKILANLKIDEHRIPQDGQFSIYVDKRPIDLRIAISPVVWGEQVVLRILDKTGTSLKLEDMGYAGRNLRELRKGLQRPHGMVLTSGPTGSGKSTSMYAMIQEIKSDTINIVTLEDPVEYKVDGINQIQVNPDVGLTFATGLRSILRQDPDVVMVGEIRDKETANLAVQAALTGHLVFSTLHTNSAAGILPRLLDMEIEPFLIASTVHTVIGQRLVRRVVPGGEEYQSNKAETEAIKQTLAGILPKDAASQAKAAGDLGYPHLPLATQNAYTLVNGKQTPDNPNGYSGRMGLYEVFEVTEAIQDLIIKHSPSSAIQKVAQAQGMVTMRQDGYLKALNGETTLVEVNRVAALGDS